MCAKRIGIEVKKKLIIEVLLLVDANVWMCSFASNAWKISKVMEMRLEAAEMWFYRKMLRMGTEMTNVEVLKKMKSKKQLMDTIRERQ